MFTLRPRCAGTDSRSSQTSSSRSPMAFGSRTADTPSRGQRHHHGRGDHGIRVPTPDRDGAGLVAVEAQRRPIHRADPLLATGRVRGLLPNISTDTFAITTVSRGAHGRTPQ